MTSAYLLLVTGSLRSNLSRAKCTAQVGMSYRLYQNDFSIIFQIRWKFHSIGIKVIAMKFCSWHHSSAVVAYAKFWSDMMNNNRFTLKHILRRIWIPMVKPFVKWDPGDCFTNVSRALQKIISKFVYCTNSTCDEYFKLKLCTCAQSLALGTRTNFQIEILTINLISGVVYFRENILGSSRNVSETAPWTV